MLVEFTLTDNRDLRLFLAAEAVLSVQDIPGKPGHARVVYAGDQQAEVYGDATAIAGRVNESLRANLVDCRGPEM